MINPDKIHRIKNAKIVALGTMGTISGVHDVFSCGHITKRDLYYRMQAFINGLCNKENI